MSARDNNAFEQKIIANVRDHGCHINYVFDPDGDMPGFAYSVIVFGLPADVMRFMINETMRQCRAGLRLDHGVELQGLLDGHSCVVCGVSPENIKSEFFNSAMWFRRHVTGEEMDAAFQIIWPGVDDGLYPWDDDCEDVVRNLQPCLIAEAVA